MKSSRSKKSRGPSRAVVERGFRVADQIQRDLSQLIRLEVKDPRIGMITFTEVEVSPDYAHAKIFYSVLPDTPEQLIKTAEGLAACRGFLRSKLGRMLQIHQTPDLHFVHDESVSRGAELSRIIDEANRVSDGLPALTADPEGPSADPEGPSADPEGPSADDPPDASVSPSPDTPSHP